MHSVALAWFHYIQNPVPNSRWQEEQCAIFRGPLNIHSNKTHLTWFTRGSHYEPRDRKVWVSILAWNVNIKYWLIPGYHSVVLYKFNNKKAWQDFSESRSTQGLIEKNKNKSKLGILDTFEILAAFCINQQHSLQNNQRMARFACQTVWLNTNNVEQITVMNIQSDHFHTDAFKYLV